MKRLLIIFATLIPLHSSSAAQPVTDRRTPSITVSGEAIIAAEPDQAEIDIGVVTQAKTALEASKENAERVARVLSEVKKLLGKGDEAKTSGYAVMPNYRYPQGGKPEIVGYTASNTLRLRITNLNLVGRLIDTAMQSGANNVNRLIFTLKDQAAAQLDALRQASAKARAKADAIAAALDLKVVRIVSVTEGERMIQPVYRDRQVLAARAETAAPTPVEPGTVEVRSTVSVTVEISEK